MAERIKPLFRLPETASYSICVHEHPVIRVIDEWGAILFGEVDPDGHPARELDFFNIHVEFDEEETDDSLQFYFAEKPDSTGRLEDVVLVVGTKNTGARLTLGMRGKREFIASNEVRYVYHPIWRKTNPYNGPQNLDNMLRYISYE